MIEIEDKGHAKLSPSGAENWMGCPAAYRAQIGTEDSTSEFAAEGTVAHEILEKCLKGGMDAAEFIGQSFTASGYTFTVDQEMADYVMECVDYVHTFPGHLFAEQQVDISRWVPECFGTSDVIKIDGNVMHVMDLKYGRGEQVYAENNKQLQLYGLGAWNDYGFIFPEIDTVVLHIMQPRLRHWDSWDTSIEALLAFGEDARVAADIALTGTGEYGPSDKACRWCRVRDVCKARAEWMLNQYAGDFEGIDDIEITELEPLDPDHLSPEQLGQLHSMAKVFNEWLKGITAKVTQLAGEGNQECGYKLVAGRNSRSFNDEDKALKTIQRREGLKIDDVRPRSAITVAQAEKLVGKKDFAKRYEKFVDVKAGSPTLAPLSDKREALPLASDDFAELPDAP